MGEKGYYYGRIMATGEGIPISFRDRELVPKRRTKGIKKGSKVPSLAFIIVSCFLMGRVTITQGITPFGIALFAVSLGMERGRLGAYLGVLGGILSTGPSLEIFRHLISMGLILLIYNMIMNTRGGNSRIVLAFITTFMVFLSSLIYRGLMPGGLLTSDYVSAILEAALIFTMVYIFNNVLSVILSSGRRRILSGEEMISMGIFMALIIVGMWDIRIYNISIKNILSILLIMVWGYIGGAGLGAAIGILVGLVLSMGLGPDAMIIAGLGICGLMTGIFRGLGKIIAGFSFLLANIFISFYFRSSPLVILSFREILISLGLLVLIPKKIFIRLGEFLDYSLLRLKEEKYYIHRIQELTVDKLMKFSAVFKELATAFGEIAGEAEREGDELPQLLNLISSQVCKDCALYSSCWERNFGTTYNEMFHIIEALESKKFAEEEGMHWNLLRRCINREGLLKASQEVYKIYKTNLKWRAKIGECRQLVAKQLDGVSRVVSQLAEDVDVRVDFKKDIEESISIELDKAGIRVDEILVMERPGGNIGVNVYKNPNKGIRDFNGRIENIVSKAVGKRMVKSENGLKLSHRKDNVLKFRQAMKFKVSTGVARMPGKRNSVSGDSYSFNSLSNGKYMLALSDGMGYGEMAAKESNAVIALLENFLEAGFDMDATIQTINSTLLLRSKEEIFATVDLCLLDLIRGEAKLTKIGAVPTFIKRDDHVEMIKGYGLPIGILDNLEPTKAKVNLQDEDMMIMVTDGILDNVQKDEGAEEWLIGVIQGLETKNPQEMADKVMESVLRVGNGNSKSASGDDMTIMVTRIWEPIT